MASLNVSGLIKSAGGSLYFDVDLIEALGDNFIRYKNGIQICWGEANTGRNATTWTNIEPFINNEYRVSATISHNGDNAENIMVAAKETSRFALRHYNSYSAEFIAIGKWK